MVYNVCTIIRQVKVISYKIMAVMFKDDYM